MDRRNALFAALSLGGFASLLEAADGLAQLRPPPAKKVAGQIGITGDQASKIDKDAIFQIDKNSAFVVLDERGLPIPKNSLSDQFFVYQLAGGSLVSPTSIEPEISTTEKAPDVLLDVQLEAFHFAESLHAENAGATMNILMNKSPLSRSAAPNLNYFVTTALKLVKPDAAKNLNPVDYQSDFSDALGSSKIGAPGGVGQLTITINRHDQPSWWSSMLDWVAGTPGGQALTAALGFPGVTSEVVKFVENMVSSVKNAQQIIDSAQMKFAFSKEAKNKLMRGDNATVACLNSGRWVMIKGSDFDAVFKTQPKLLTEYGLLYPSKTAPEDVVKANYQDPFREITYAVFNVDLAAGNVANLKPS